MADPLPAFPYVMLNGPGNMPDADQVMADYEHIRTWLNARLGNLASAQILIGNASGVATPRGITGDITLSNTGNAQIVADAVGAAEIAPGAVGNTELADGAVTGGKVADTSIGAVKLNLSKLSADDADGGALTSSYVNLASLGAVAAGTYLVFGVVSFAATGGSSTAYVRISGDTDSEVQGKASADDNSGTAVSTRTMDGSTVLAVQGRMDAVGGVAGIYYRARISATRIG